MSAPAGGTSPGQGGSAGSGRDGGAKGSGMNGRRWKSFLLGSVFGGIVTALVRPRLGRSVEGGGRRLIEQNHAFSSAPCYRPDDRFT